MQFAKFYCALSTYYKARSIKEQYDDAGIIATMLGAMKMNGNTIWLWLVIGLIPYNIKCQHMRNVRRTLEVRAMFWSLVIHQQTSRGYEWTILVPFIERIRKVVWKAVMLLQEDEPIQK